MLVLTRKDGESVQIGDAIMVKVLAISGNRVKLGFSAPAEVAIRRKEILPAVSLPLSAWQDEALAGPPVSRAACQL